MEEEEKEGEKKEDEKQLEEEKEEEEEEEEKGRVKKSYIFLLAVQISPSEALEAAIHQHSRQAYALINITLLTSIWTPQQLGKTK